MPDGPVVALIVFVVVGALAALYFFVDYRRHRREGHHEHARAAERLPLFGTDMLATRGEDGLLHVGEDGDAAPPRRVPRSMPPANVTPTARPLSPSVAAWTPPPPRVPLEHAGNGRPAAPQPAPFGAALAPSSDPAFANGETLRFALPDEGTLRFLPGRLEVVAGPDAGREVRFVAPPGSANNVEITFGRTEGPPHRHVQLLARTVSRQHASMCLSDDHWSLKNLSATNPVVLNGRHMAPDEVAPLLVDGDRIEMGEVVFTFYGR